MKSPKIECTVSRGAHAGEPQWPAKNKHGDFALSATRFEKGYILVSDLFSVANGLKADLQVRKASNNAEPSLRRPEEVTIDGKPVGEYDPPDQK